MAADNSCGLTPPLLEWLDCSSGKACTFLATWESEYQEGWLGMAAHSAVSPVPAPVRCMHAGGLRRWSCTAQLCALPS
jgi:hypothetical protein